MAFETLGNITGNRIEKPESYNLTDGYTPSAVMVEGTIVKLDVATEGNVTPVTATSDLALFMVMQGAQNITDQDVRVTVATPFQAIVNGVAVGAIALNDKLAAKQVDTGSLKLMQFKKAIAGDTVVGIATASASDGGTFRLGILRQFHTLNTTPSNFAQAASNADVATANASDLATAIALVNALKTSFNALQAKLRTANMLAP